MTTLIVTLRDRDARDIVRQLPNSAGRAAEPSTVRACGVESNNLIHLARLADVVIVTDDACRYVSGWHQERLREVEHHCRAHNIIFVRL